MESIRCRIFPSVALLRTGLALALVGAALHADTLTMSSGTSYVTVTPAGALAGDSNAAKAQTFERLYAGNGYFYLRVHGLGYVATSRSTGALEVSAATTTAAEQFATAAAGGSNVKLMVRSTAGYASLTGTGVAANATLANASAFTLAALAGAAPDVEFDFSNPRQQIAGFGAADAFYSGWLTAHPYKEEIYALLFAPENLGASILRVQNIYGQQQQQPPTFDPDTQEVVTKANTYRRAPITVLMSSWSPPAALKASGEVSCHGGSIEPGCTLAKLNGSFNYAGYAQYWVDSLNAYAGLGVRPDYISLQNEPDWIPGGYGGCRFDPAEINGGTYAGYKQALNATYARLSALPAPPVIVGPELVGIGWNTIEGYLSALNAQDLGQMGAVAHHLYTGGDSNTPDTFNAPMFQLAAAAPSKLLFQTEYDHSAAQTSAMQTAWLIHNSMATEEASAYLFWSLFWPDANQLVSIDNPWTPAQWTYGAKGYKVNDYFYALQHFSRFVQPHFRRIASPTSMAELRVSAYYRDRPARLVVVLINTSAANTLSPALDLADRRDVTTAVYRSNFSTAGERFATLGPLAAGSVVTLPPQSVATVVIDGVGPARQGSTRQ